MKSIKITYSFLVLVLVAFGCNSNSRNSNINETKAFVVKDTVNLVDSVQKVIDNKRIITDAYFETDNKILLYALLNSGEIEVVESEDHWPDDISVVFNLLLDTLGFPILFKQIPISESGDSEIIYSYYFERSGDTYLTIIEINFFNDSCDDSVIRETKTLYYWNNELLFSNNELVNDQGKLLNEECSYQLQHSFIEYKHFEETPITKFVSIPKN